MQYNETKLVRPNLFLIGAPKSGTTTLAGLLGQHPEILLSSPKEPSFFHKDIYQKGMDWYSKKYFRGYNQEKIVLDASQSYMHVQYVIPRIEESCENPKFIFLLREPIARAYVNYRMFYNWRPGYCRDSFEEELLFNLRFFSRDRFKYEYEVMSDIDFKGGNYKTCFIEQGLYYTHMKRYINAFGSKNIFWGEMEDLNSNDMYYSILNFLEVGYFKPIFEIRNVTASKHPDYPDLLYLCNKYPNAYKVAKEIYLPEVENLSEYTGIDFISQWEYDKL